MASWKLYDELIEGVDPKIKVADFVCGVSWTSVTSSEGGLGLSLTYDVPCMPFSSLHRSLQGASLKDAAAMAKSWNFLEAGLGIAAINAYYNTPDRVTSCGVPLAIPENESKDAFDVYGKEIAGKRVAVVGAFPRIERYESACDLIVLERHPDVGYYPDSACEFLLADRDYVFITGSTMVNKTMPRLLELSVDAKVVLVGPSTTLCQTMFNNGVFGLSGLVVSNPARCTEVVRGGAHKSVLRTGDMVDRRVS